VLPDVALIEVTGEARVVLEKIPAMPVLTDLRNVSQAGLLAVGQGLDSFALKAVHGELKIGLVEAEEMTPGLGLKTIWGFESEDFVALRRGDSGGPLLALQNDGSLSLIGLASASSTETNEKGEVKKSITYFALLNDGAMAKWLTEKIKNGKKESKFKKTVVVRITPDKKIARPDVLNAIAAYHLQILRRAEGRFRDDEERERYIAERLTEADYGSFSTSDASELARLICNNPQLKVSQVIANYLGFTDCKRAVKQLDGP
jgi:hypothetical protein